MSKLTAAIKKYAPVAAAAGLGFVTGGATWALGAGLATYGITEQNEENKKLAEQTSAFNSAEAQATREWQENLSNTAHQREVEDLKAAGLNPVLSAGGTGATTPAGATATGAQATAENKLANAMAIENMYLQNDKLRAETNLIDTQAQYVGYGSDTTSTATSVNNIFGVGTSASNTKTKQKMLSPIHKRRNAAMDLK